MQYDFTEADEDKASLGVDVARLYMDQLDDLEKAEATFQKCLDWDENCLDAMAGLGDLYFSQGRFDQSTEQFESYLRSGADVSVEDRTRFVVALRNIGQFDKALEASVEVLELDPANRDAREIRVEILEARGNKVALERELTAYEALLDDDADNRLKFTVQSRLGQLALENDELAVSREWFEKASRLNEQDAETMGALRGDRRARRALGRRRSLWRKGIGASRFWSAAP